MQSQVEIEIPSGPTLEADLISNQSSNSKLAICLHPWSWLGGNKDDPVLLSLQEPLIERGYHVLRYNSRGVGGSKGWPSFTGLTEGEDLKAVVQWAIDRLAKVNTVLLMGYSHGSLITSLHPVLPEPIRTQHILLSYPLGPRGPLTLFKSSTYATKLNELLQDPRSNVAVVFGDQDEFTGIKNYEEWSNMLEKHGAQVVRVPGGGHFWRKGRELRSVVMGLCD